MKDRIWTGIGRRDLLRISALAGRGGISDAAAQQPGQPWVAGAGKARLTFEEVLISCRTPWKSVAFVAVAA